jgi:hypothetical protein
MIRFLMKKRPYPSWDVVPLLLSFLLGVFAALIYVSLTEDASAYSHGEHENDCRFCAATANPFR